MVYNNAKIYQVLNSVNDEVYVGSTCQALSKRMHQHKYYCHKKDYEFYKLMRDTGEDNFILN